MTKRLRRAQLSDLEAIVAIKEALPLDPDRRSAGGGFLLGCSRDRYATAIETADVFLIEEHEVVGGFAIALPDAVLRESPVWKRRDLIRWNAGEAEPPADEQVAYFDQLALRPRWPRLHALFLALASARELAEAGHVHLYVTILDKPLRNEAAVPLLRAIGGKAVGNVDEDYEDVGRVVSELHHVRLQDGLAALAATGAGQRVLRAMLSARAGPDPARR
jgi:hypothetical protein